MCTVSPSRMPRTIGTHAELLKKLAGSVTVAVFATVPDPNTMPPAAGRTTVWIQSLIESIAGILSATISMTSSTPGMICPQPFSSHAHPAGRLTRSVNRLSSPSTSGGMYGVEPRRSGQSCAGRHREHEPRLAIG